MFGREYRIPIDIMFSTGTNNTQCSTIREYEDKLKQIYEIDRKYMQTKQCKATTYYNGKMKDNVLKKEDLVFICLS